MEAELAEWGLVRENGGGSDAWARLITNLLQGSV